MAEFDFSHYKQQMRDYLKAQSPGAPATNLDIVKILDGMRSTFPKKPDRSDRLAVCYAYWYRTQMPTEQDYLKDWHKQIKAYINGTTDQNQSTDNGLFFMLHNLIQTADVSSKKESFDYAEKAIKKMRINLQNHPKTHELLGHLARPYYDELFKNAVELKDDGKNYSERIKAFDKAATVLMKIPHTVRYQKSIELMRAMHPVYMECEWGRQEYGRKCSSIRHRVYQSMPADVQLAMRNAKAKRDWYYK